MSDHNFRCTSGGICMRVYYHKAKPVNNNTGYDRFYDVHSAVDALNIIVANDRFNPMKRIDRILLWASWNSFRHQRWCGTSESYVLGPFSNMDELDEAIGNLWESVTAKAKVAGVRVDDYVGTALYELVEPPTKSKAKK